MSRLSGWLLVPVRWQKLRFFSKTCLSELWKYLTEFQKWVYSIVPCCCSSALERLTNHQKDRALDSRAATWRFFMPMLPFAVEYILPGRSAFSTPFQYTAEFPQGKKNVYFTIHPGENSVFLEFFNAIFVLNWSIFSLESRRETLGY